MAERNAVERASIQVSDDGLAELDQGRRNVFVRRGEIRQVALAYGLGAERPLLSGILAVLALLVGLWPVVSFLAFLNQGGVFQGETLYAVAFLALGGWLLYFSLRKRVHLRVRTEKTARKLLFHGPLREVDLQDLLRVAEQDYGYSIQREVDLAELRRRGLVQAG